MTDTPNPGNWPIRGSEGVPLNHERVWTHRAGRAGAKGAQEMIVVSTVPCVFRPQYSGQDLIAVCVICGQARAAYAPSSLRVPWPECPAIKAALHVAADAMFMEAAPDEAPLAADCPEAHAALVRQAAAAVAAFQRAFGHNVFAEIVERAAREAGGG